MTNIEAGETRSHYLALANDRKHVFLALLSYGLSIDGRAYVLDSSVDTLIRRLTGLNELQHQISQHIAALGLGRDRYPDDVLWNVLQEKAAQYEIQNALEHSLRFAHSRSL